MRKRNFRELLNAKYAKDKFVCVGLDPVYEKIPQHIQDGDEHETISQFTCRIVDTTSDIVCAYKLNFASYVQYGKNGFDALSDTIMYIQSVAPHVPVILDAKFGDVEHTNTAYAETAFGVLSADAVTVNPYLGFKPLLPFILYGGKGKGIFIVCKTSNPGSEMIQDLSVPINNADGRCLEGIGVRYSHGEGGYRTPMTNYIALKTGGIRSPYGKCGVVVDATHPHVLREVRTIIGDEIILIPGIGAQGGNLERVVKAAKSSHGKGFIVSASRSIIFASKGTDFATAAQQETLKLHGAVQQCLEKGHE